MRFVARRVDDAALGEDIVQEAYVRLLSHQAQPGNVVTNVGALLRRIALNLTRDHFRGLRRTAVVELSDDIPCSRPDIHQQLEQRQLIDNVVTALKAMPRLRRDVFIRRRIHGESSREVAGAMGLSVGAVNVHVARAVLDLHRAMDRIGKRGRR